MRALPLAVLLAATGCNPGITPHNNQNGAPPQRNLVAPTRPASPNPPAVNPPTNAVEAAEPATPPGVAGMSPYRRREYERGYRDCLTGNFDGERQGESYRIGCMAAEDVKQRR
jgi:hypothetical protein